MRSDLLAGRYEMIERLAGGGMGQVWRGRDQVLERIVAIKTVDLASQDATMRERFRREAVATAGLSAANVVQVYDAGTDGDTAYLVMELLTGPSLSELIHDQGPLSIEQGIHITQEVVKGLLAAHRIGVIHRDIKPGNVMYHGDQIKLVDFGIAQLTRTMGAQLTAPATAMGTAAYMSPEQATGEGASEKSDWYALGCLMMTMFTGEPPFRGEALAVATQQITAQPPYLSQRRPDVPPALDQLVARMLSKDPAARPTGEQVLEQLRLLQIDPNAGTIAMPSAAPTGATAVMPPTDDDFATQSGARFARTPTEPSGRVVPAPAPAPAPVAVRNRRRMWPAVVGVLVVLLIGAGAVFAMLNLNQGIAPVTTPSPTASPTPTATSTRAPATTRRTTTQPPTTQTTTAAPSPTATTPDAPSSPPSAPTSPDAGPSESEAPGNNGNNGNNGNSGNSGNNGNNNANDIGNGSGGSNGGNGPSRNAADNANGASDAP